MTEDEGGCLAGHLWVRHQDGYDRTTGQPRFYLQCERCGKVSLG